jgi:lysophospholipase L1-like esterase
VTLLEKKIQEKNPVSQTYNLGVSGTNPSEYNAVIEEFAPILHPKTIVVSYYLGNDITCKKETIFSTILIHLRTLIKNICMEYTYKKEKEMFLQSSVISEEYKQYLQENTLDMNYVRQRIYKPNLTAEYYTTIHWFAVCENNKQEIMDIKESASRNNATLIVVIIPSKYQVTRMKKDPHINVDFIFNESLLTDRQLQDAILSFCKEQNITCIDALPPLQASSESPYFTRDTHFNKKGHEIIAEMLFSYLYPVETINQTTEG